MTDEELREILASHTRLLEHVTPPVLPAIRRRARRQAIRATASALAATAVLGTVLAGAGWAISQSHAARTGSQPAAHPPGAHPPPAPQPSAPRPAAHPSSAPDRAARPCAARSLRLGTVRQPASTMPGIVTAVLFRNTGTITCWLKGWPQVTVPPRAPGDPLVKVQDVQGTGSWSVAVTRVVLRPGQSAAANLMIGEAAGTGTCGSRAWAVTPPGGQRAVTVHERLTWPDACTANGLAVSPVYPARYAPLTGNYPR
jgi:hypothetical protein